MLQRRVCDNRVVIYESPLLVAAGVPHAFSTRLGGVSAGPFESMNLGNPGGQSLQDSPQNITENYRRLHAAIGCGERRRVFAHQIHGDCVLDAATSPQTDSIHGGCEIGKGDALVTTDPSLVLSVRTADCVPVLLADRSGRRVAAIHAGWRGVVAGVARAALQHFNDPTSVLAAIGPSIGFDAFEVGPEVLAAYVSLPLRRRSECLHQGTDGKGRVDLRRVLALQLQAAGVPEQQIESTDCCTVTDEAEFFSHRRTGGLTGRMAALIGTIE